jgi:hypothetical protein
MRTTFAPRISLNVLDAIADLDDRTVPIAEVNRRVGAAAQRLGYPRPSYQRVRQLVHRIRSIRRRRRSAGGLLVDVAFRVRPPEALLELVDPDAGPVDERAGLGRGPP